MMNKLQFNSSKTLKMINVLGYKMHLNSTENTDTIIEQMQSYIKVKGAKQIGPLIQYMKTNVSNSGELEIEITIYLQCNIFILNLDKQYFMESLIRVPKSMFCRYIGPRDKMNFAYDKINLVAFEEEIELSGDNYTVYVENDDDSDNIVIDVFMPRRN